MPLSIGSGFDSDVTMWWNVRVTMSQLSRRDFLRAAAAAPLAACATKPAAARPNIILIMADDLGWETLGSYGGESYKTPELDRLASQGVRFEHAYAQPLCTPTRLQLMTGLYNYRNWKAFGIMDPEEPTFGHHMKAAGYKTCISGKWQFYSYNPPDFEPEYRGKGKRIEDAGFDEHCVWHALHTEDKGSRYADPVIYENGKLSTRQGEYGPDVYTAYINSFLERHRDQPFFVYYPMALTHGPFPPTPRQEAWKTGDRHKSDAQANFGAMVEYMDEIIGRIARKVDELGLGERTLILFYGDNGSPRDVRSKWRGQIVQGAKGKPTDLGTRVPLIARWTGTAPAGRVLDDLVDSTDFLPTMLDAAGAKRPDLKLDGVSFLPQIKGEKGTPREWVLVHHDPRPGWDKAPYTLVRFARDQRYKLYEEGNLFDISTDMLEERPLDPASESPEAKGARQKLRAVLDRMRPAT